MNKWLHWFTLTGESKQRNYTLDIPINTAQFDRGGIVSINASYMI